MKKRFTEEQIIGFLKEADPRVSVQALCRKHGFSDASYCKWKATFGGMDVSEAKRLKALEDKNGLLKKLLADAMLDNEALKVVLAKKWRPAAAARGCISGDGHDLNLPATRLRADAHLDLCGALPGAS
jgi:putative transposase